MAVSKGLRYQVMRRDGFTCTYCGATPPDARLVVDHVTPKALGGSDEPSNLATACTDCNSGKSATPADAATVDGVAQANAEFRRIMDQLADEEWNDADTRWFDAEWNQWNLHYETRMEKVPRPGNWPASVKVWIDRGLTRQDIHHAMTIAMERKGIPPGDRFRYMAGILWNILDDREKKAAQLLQDES